MPSIAPLNVEQKDLAPHYPVPQQRIIALEHIGVVKNVENATASLGGEQRLNEFLTSPSAEKSIGLYLQHKDPFRRPIVSAKVSTSNALLKVSLPKRKGRKRKRRSQDAFVAVDDEPMRSETGFETGIVTDMRVMARSMRDNPAKCKLEAVGLVSETYRFRDLPDFVWSTMTSRTAKDIQDKLLPLNWAKAKHFHIDLDTKGNVPDIDMIPPPIVIRQPFPHQYQYTQASYSRATTGAGPSNLASTNLAGAPRKRMAMLKYGAATIPQSPPPNVEPEHTLSDYARNLIATIRALFTARPIMTRRFLHNSLPIEVIYDVPFAVQYCAYQFSSGPWKDAMIAFGLDPRTDPECRKYQTIALRGHKRPLLPAALKAAQEAVAAGRDPAEVVAEEVAEEVRDGKYVNGKRKLGKRKPKAKAKLVHTPGPTVKRGLGAKARTRINKAARAAVKETPWHWRRPHIPQKPPTGPSPVSKFHSSTAQPSESAGAGPSNANTASQDTQDARNRLSHLFDGRTVDPEMHTWQVCDITDPQLAFLHTCAPRPVCDIRCDGWMPNGAWAKARVVMREKLKVCKLGQVPEERHYAQVLAFPDVVTDVWVADTTGQGNGGSWVQGNNGAGMGGDERRLGQKGTQCWLEKGTIHELEMATQIRQMCRGDVASSRGRGVEMEQDFSEESSDEDGVDGLGLDELRGLVRGELRDQYENDGGMQRKAEGEQADFAIDDDQMVEEDDEDLEQMAEGEQEDFAIDDNQIDVEQDEDEADDAAPAGDDDQMDDEQDEGDDAAQVDGEAYEDDLLPDAAAEDEDELDDISGNWPSMMHRSLAAQISLNGNEEDVDEA